MRVSDAIGRIREIVGKIEGDEEEVLDALMDEAENWKMRLTELRKVSDEKHDLHHKEVVP